MSEREEKRRRTKHKRSRHSRSESWSDPGSRSRSRSRKRRSYSRSRSNSRSPYRGHNSRSHSKGRYRRSYSRSSYDGNRSRSRSRDRHGHRSSNADRDRNRSQSPRRPYRSRRERSTSPLSDRRRHVGNRDNPEENSCIGVFGLSLYTTERDLKDVYLVYGPLESCNVVYDHNTGRSRGFAFVTFKNTDDARDAKERTDGMEIDGRRIRVDFSITHRAHTPTPGIYMGQPTFPDRRSTAYPRTFSPEHGRPRSYSRSRSTSRKRSLSRSKSRSRSRGR